MKTLNIVMLLLLFSPAVHSQEKYFTKTGKIFFRCAKSPLERVEATNKSTTCVLDTKTGNMQFAVMMKGFEFEKAMMQEHFNENYVESTKFPRSDFKGQIVNNSEINYSKDGTYPARVKGKLQIHGEIKDVEATGTILIKDGKIVSNAVFTVLLSDYNISIPSLVSDKISNTVNITVDCSLEPLKS
ncbi:MAG TPA: YceI family protein [Chitinophagaceae bacterium]|nr:YceI family protein [Chitinophagaceae bacterium]